MFPTPFQSASLYVGDLAADVTEGKLFETFNTVGPVASIRVCRDAVTRLSLGYAYVNFHHVADAERGLDTLNNTAINGRICRIMWSQRDPSLRRSGVGNIYIKNLDKSIDHRALYDTFSAFGNILSCKVSLDDQGRSKGFGFVHFETQEQAQKAIDRVNGMMLNGKQVFVGPFVPQRERHPGGNASRFTNVFLKNMPESWGQEELETCMGRFGSITSATVMTHDDGTSKCFGFVNYDTSDAAKDAVEAMNGSEHDGKTLYCGRAQTKAEREAELKNKFDMLKAERMAKFQGVNLYVKNLEDDWDDTRLKAEFGVYGTITSAKVMRDDRDLSRGFGFVCFAEPEEATRAITEMNGRMVGVKPLYVAMAQRKDVRRAQLEAQLAQRSGGKRGSVGGGGGSGAPGGPSGLYPAGSPFYYPAGMPGPGPGQQFLYPHPAGPMMGRNRWGPVPPGMYQPALANYMVQMQRQGRGGAGGGGGRSSGTGRRMNGGGRPGGSSNANRDSGMPHGVSSGTAPPLAAAAALAQLPMEPLTLAALTQYPAEQQINIIGERLFAMIQRVQPELAGKITGMLLERYSTAMDELVALVNNEAELNNKIAQALEVLDQYAQRAEKGLGEE